LENRYLIPILFQWSLDKLELDLIKTYLWSLTIKPKTTLLISIALTTFILVIIAGVVKSVSASNANTGSTSIDSAEVQQIIADREAAYNQVLDEANSRIAELQSQLDSQQTGQDNSATPVTTIRPDQAAVIANSVAASGSTLLGTSELVDFEGVTAFEVAYQQGNIYVDAGTGNVLYNGTIVLAAPKINAQDAAQIAANYLGDDKIYNVNTTTLNGETVYAVKFKSGTVVIVSDTGELLLVRLYSGSGSVSGASGGEGDHENEHDDD
jgi:hypothetical protein